MNQPNKERFKTSVGGQALMEGIMMRGPKLICCAVRKPDGTIETKTEPTPTHGIWTKIPLVRGAISMIESLIMGYRYMMYSAQVSMGDDYDPEEEETAFEKWVGEHLGKKAEDALLACAAVLGGLLTLLARPRSHKFFSREGYIIVALAWVLLSAVGALPFWFSREIPSYADAFFETVSGFTTTGASILTDVEAMSHGLLFWRSFTHWVGGMGVLVFITMLSGSTDRSMNILKAEMPGPVKGKLTPRTRDTARVLYLLYFLITAVLVGMLLLGGMPLFDSLVHAFGTVGTGGFGIRADSIASYSPYIQGVITVFMILCGINFNLYYLLLLRQWRAALRSDELWTYLGLAVVATGVITLDLRGVYGGLGACLRQAAFQVSSVLTTTGYATADFDLWPGLSRAILFALLFIGGCAGSTAGGLKVSRAMILLRTIRREINRLVHPRRVTAVRCDGKALSSEVQRGVSIYFALYCLCILITFLCLSGEPFTLETNLSAVVSCFNNVGPGLGAVGPAGSYAGYSVLSKLLLSAAMLMGRLEIYPMLVALSPSVWRKD